MFLHVTNVSGPTGHVRQESVDIPLVFDFHRFVPFESNGDDDNRAGGSLLIELTESDRRRAKRFPNIYYRCTIDPEGKTVAFSCRTKRTNFDADVNEQTFRKMSVSSAPCSPTISGKP